MIGGKGGKVVLVSLRIIPIRGYLFKEEDV